MGKKKVSDLWRACMRRIAMRVVFPKPADTCPLAQQDDSNSASPAASPKKGAKKPGKKEKKAKVIRHMCRVFPAHLVDIGLQDPNAPKRAISAYLYFASERRPDLKKENPDLSFGDLTKNIAAEWKELSEKDKKKYNDLAKAGA